MSILLVTVLVGHFFDEIDEFMLTLSSRCGCYVCCNPLAAGDSSHTSYKFEGLLSLTKACKILSLSLHSLTF